MFVLWHKNPDTDAILSAMIYVKFLETQGKAAQAIKLGTCNNETRYCLAQLGWEEPELMQMLQAGSKVTLVDHNEISQTIDGIESLDVVGIIDHHKFAFTTSAPIEIIVKPIASTCSVIYWLWKETGAAIPADVAKAMLMGIYSDTLYFRSPTTTEYDKVIASELASLAWVTDGEGLSLAMFAAKSNLGDISVRDLILIDYKVFEGGSKKFGSGTIETTNPSYTLGRKDEIIADLVTLKQEQWLDMIMLSVVDILNETNVTLYADDTDKGILESVFGATGEDNIISLWNRISRKKQIAPALTNYFTAQ
jgi:manganese-dependent inorganic pyrophosphatase